MTYAARRVNVRRMEARNTRIKGLIQRLAVVALATLILVGLWQGYGAWLTRVVHAG